MNHDNKTIEQLEAERMAIDKEIERRKAIKPKASLEEVYKAFEDLEAKGRSNLSLRNVDEVLSRLDWTPYEKPLWMRELVSRMPCLIRESKHVNPDSEWEVDLFMGMISGMDQRPFDEALVGKVTE